MAQRTRISATAIRNAVAAETDLNVLRMHYCYQVGSTFVSLGFLEDAIIQAMTMCDRIKVSGVLGSDAPAWERLLEKREVLQSSTLGSVISILAKHSILDRDLSYLRWVKVRRGFFVHRFFHDHRWPGDLGPIGVDEGCRRLLYLEKMFLRASGRIWKIFARAGLIQYVDLGADGAIIINNDVFPFK